MSFKKKEKKRKHTLLGFPKRLLEQAPPLDYIGQKDS